MPPQDERPLFVETTIPIWRRTMPKEVRRRIDKTLSERHPISSTYVRAEYINTYVRAAVDLHNVIVDSEDLEDARSRWMLHWAGSIKELGTNILFMVIQDEETKEDALLRLRIFIDSTLYLWFEETIPTLTDTTLCQPAHIRPHYNGLTYDPLPSFPPKEATDGLRTFLAAKQPLLQMLEAAIDAADQEWNKVTDCVRLKQALSDLLANRYALGPKKWRTLSDTIIALEAHHHESEIYSGNVKDYKPICKTLDLPFKPEYIKIMNTEVQDSTEI